MGTDKRSCTWAQCSGTVLSRALHWGRGEAQLSESQGVKAARLGLRRSALQLHPCCASVGDAGAVLPQQLPVCLDRHGLRNALMVGSWVSRVLAVCSLPP